MLPSTSHYIVGDKPNEMFANTLKCILISHCS